jgi:general secretion pathway protein M
MTRTQVLQARWATMAPQERRLVGWAAALIVIALLWWIALAPALRTLGAAPDEHARLDAQLQRMSTLAAQAKALQSVPKASRDDAARALEGSVRQQLGPNGQLGNAGASEGATVMVRGVSADVLAPWLAQVRGNARALPREAHLTRSQQPAPIATGAIAGNANAADEAAKVRWDGTLVMSLPAR